MAIKPKAFVTEAFFIANASKVLAANWGAQTRTAHGRADLKPP